MGVISQIKCARCDRKYSGVRGRCPYCGARRIGRGKYSEEYESSKGKMLVSILIMLVLVVAVGVLAFSAPRTDTDNGDTSGGLNLTNPDLEYGTEGYGDPPPDNGGQGEEDCPEDCECEDCVEFVPMPTLQLARVLWNTRGGRQFQSGPEGPEFTLIVGESLPLILNIVPDNAEVDIEWRSSDDSVFSVTAVAADETRRTATAVGTGTGRAWLYAVVSAGYVTIETERVLVRGRR